MGEAPGCTTKVWPYLAFFVAILLAFSVLQVVQSPSIEQWNAVMYFIFVEVGKNLYLQFVWTVPVFYLLRNYPKPFLVLFSLCGFILFLHVTAYYFVPVSVLNNVPEQIRNVLRLEACDTTNSTCSILQDVKFIHGEEDKGGQIWIDDAAFVYIVSIPFILLESKRYDLPFGLGYLVLSFILGFDVVLPFFFMHLQDAERQKAGKTSRRFAWLYFLLAVVSAAAWLPNLYAWIIKVGTVAGQLEAGCKTVIGARATWAIMGISFSFGFYSVGWCHITLSKNKIINFISSAILMTLLLILITSNVAAAMSMFLFFRETLMPFPSFMPKDKKIKNGK